MTRALWTTLVDSTRLAAHLDDPDWLVFDCRFDLADPARGAHDFEAAHIPGARYAHLDRDLSGPLTATAGRHPLPDPQHLCAWLARQGMQPGRQVVAYDDSGGAMAVRLWWLLRWLGHERVAVLDGGWPVWRAADLPSVAGTAPSVPSGRFAAAPDDRQVLTTSELLASLAHPGSGPLLIDVRNGERFRGIHEPIDPIAGHIPGAINLPLSDNLAGDGRFLPPDRLAERYRAALDGRNPTQVAAMCGSGVTACHALLAMAVAGLPGARLYAGSWSEWIRDPSRPIATGD